MYNINCVHPLFHILIIFLKFFLLILLKLILRMYRLRCLSAPQAKKLGFFTHFKRFSIHFSLILILERNGRFHRSVDFHRSVPFLRRNGNGERNGTERCRAGTGKHWSDGLELFKSLISNFTRLGDSIGKQILTFSLHLALDLLFWLARNKWIDYSKQAQKCTIFGVQKIPQP